MPYRLSVGKGLLTNLLDWYVIKTPERERHLFGENPVRPHMGCSPVRATGGVI